ncbi:MAG: UvrD-helicase domain-containing protein [Eubacterium sp.]|nr:UvrD-helicase domain-containing protein [Eubacterium sp.]
MHYLTELNDKQMEAVKNTEGYVRVIAGAGSGKTKLLVSRYAYLVKEYGVDPKNILCVTFTNKAAAEMKKRIRTLIGDEYDTTLICTYHGFCARLLRENPEKLYMTKNFQIIDTTQQRSILGEIYQKYELKLDNASFGSILKMIGEYKSTHMYVPLICSPENKQIVDDISAMDSLIIEDYMQRQKAIYALDFEDLLQFAIYLLKTDEDVREKWQNRLNYIQVDEFQDSSKTEMTLIDILSEKFENLMIVGDPDQNIYEWRGSTVELLVDFEKTHIPTNTIYLNQNYRSTPEILKCANTVIAHNKMRLEKDLFTLAPHGDEVIHFHSKDDESELKSIVSNIKSLHKTQKDGYSDFAILYRSSFLSRLIEKKLVENNIPYEIYGGVRFYDRMEIQDIIAYLRHIAFEDDLSFLRIVNKPRRKFGRVKLNTLQTLQETHNDETDACMSLYETLVNNIGNSAFKGSGVRDFIEATEDVRAQKGKLRITEIVNKVCNDFGYEKYIRELGDEERLDNLTEFKRIADEFESSFGEDLTLEEFLQQIALQSSEGEEKGRESVKLMTIHAAKGLEFPVVFIVGFTEGIFPSSKTIEERKAAGLEEERRLCYVALTRARERLFLMDSEGFSQNGIKKLPSRFLREIGEENYNRIGVISDGLEWESRNYERMHTPLEPSAAAADEGKEVTHHIFGKGKIISTDSVSRSYRIQFDSLPNPRNIMMSYFNKAKETLSKEDDVKTVPGMKNLQYTVIPDEDIKPVEENTYSDVQKEVPDINAGFEAEEVFDIPELKALSANPPSPEELEEQAKAEAVKKQLEDCDNLWKRDDVPKTGWICEGVTDLGGPYGVCQMCGYQIIRYVHHMVHPEYGRVDAGCVCAGKMEGNIEAAKEREQEAKNKASRRENFKKRKWKTSRNGNSYIKVKDHIVVLYKRKTDNVWKYSIDNAFCIEVFETKEEAQMAAFEALDAILKK